MILRRFTASFLIILAAGCQLIPSTISPHPSTIPTMSSTLPSSIPTTALTLTATLTPTLASMPSGPLVLIAKTINETSSKPAYTLKASYPQITPAVNENLKKFNLESEKIATDLASDFQKSQQDSKITPDPTFMPSFRQLSYSVTHGVHGLLSINFKVDGYESGAAHPYQYTMVLNYDLQHGKVLMLKDLFLPGMDYIKVIADYCVSDLKRQDRLEFPKGAAPTESNYQNWNITDKGLLISFDAYQVGPYAMGPSTVMVPYSSLQGLLNPNGVLAPILGKQMD